MTITLSGLMFLPEKDTLLTQKKATVYPSDQLFQA